MLEAQKKSQGTHIKSNIRLKPRANGYRECIIIGHICTHLSLCFIFGDTGYSDD